MNLVRGLLVATLSVVALVVVAVVGGIGWIAWESRNTCPEPQLANPATVVWSGTTMVSGERGASPDGGRSLAEVFVVSWPASRGDPLPASHYGAGGLSATGPSTVTARYVRSREVAVEIQRAPADASLHTHVEVSLGFADTRDVVKCRHAGRGDDYGVVLALDIDWPTHTATARFGEVSMHAGACSAGGPAVRGAGGYVVLVALLVGATVARRRRRALGPGIRAHEPSEVAVEL